MNKLAFIIGTGRCGSTLLAQMLNSHSQLCVPPELQIIFEHDGNGNRLYEAFGYKASCVTASELIEIIERCCPYKLTEFFDYISYFQQGGLPRDSLGEFLSHFYASIASSYGKTWLVEQTPWYGQRLDILSNLFPEAKFIHIVRDGRDVALSFSRTPWWYKNVNLNLSRWQKEIKKIILDANWFLSPSSYIEVKYENLLQNSSGELRRICDFLEIDFEPSILDSSTYIDYDQFCNFDIDQVSSDAYKKKKENSSFLFNDNLYAWRKTDYFSECIPEEISTWLSYMGYEIPTSDSKICPPSGLYEFEIKDYITALETNHTSLTNEIADLKNKYDEVDLELKKYRSTWHYKLKSFFEKL